MLVYNKNQACHGLSCPTLTIIVLTPSSVVFATSGEFVISAFATDEDKPILGLGGRRG